MINDTLCAVVCCFIFSAILLIVQSIIDAGDKHENK